MYNKQDKSKALDSIEQINTFWKVIDFDNKNFCDLEDTLQLQHYLH